MPEENNGRLVTYPCDLAEEWHLLGLAEITDAYGTHEGAAALALATRSGFIDPDSDSEAEIVVPFRIYPYPGLTWAIRFWWLIDRSGGAVYDLTARVWNGFAWQVALVFPRLSTDVWREQTIILTPAQGASNGFGLIKFESSPPWPPPQVQWARWLIDDIRIFGAVKTTILRQALEADLADIDGTGVFYTTLAQIAREPSGMAEMIYPAVYIVPGGGSSDDLEERTNLTGVATQEWELRLYVNSETPHADIEQLLDDVRVAIGRTTGNLQNVDGVHYAGVSEWPDEVRTSPAGHKQLGEIELTVQVRYEYARNTL